MIHPPDDGCPYCDYENGRLCDQCDLDASRPVGPEGGLACLLLLACVMPPVVWWICRWL